MKEGKKYPLIAGFLFLLGMTAVFFSNAFAAAAVDGIAGFATQNGGTTGGAGGEVVTVTNLADFMTAVRDADPTPRTVYINVPELNSGDDKGMQVKLGSNKTIIGCGAGTFMNGILLGINAKSNIIIRNLKFTMISITNTTDPAVYDPDGDEGRPQIIVNGGDCISIQSTSSNIWIDHCEFYQQDPNVQTNQDLYDGLIDIKNGSQYITISWCYFHDHHKCHLVGSSDTDNYDRKTTFHHNYYNNIEERMPSYRFGTGHVFNNYFYKILNAGVNSRMEACLRVERNYFENSIDPIVAENSTLDGYWDLHDSVSGADNSNIYSGCSGNQPTASNCAFTPPYAYSSFLDAAADAKAIVLANAGIGKINTGCGAVNTPTNTPVTPSPTPVVKQAWRVNAGGPAYTDSQGNAWSADTNFSGGTAKTLTNSISNTADPALYQSERYGSPFTYAFNVPAGSYQVTLKFAETYQTAAGARVFNVSINGAQVLTNFDIFSVSGAQYKAYDRVFSNITPVNGLITIQFGPASVDNAQVCAVEIIPQQATPTNTFTSLPTNTPTKTGTPTPLVTVTTAKNPLIWADVPDPSVIRVGNNYYMSSTTMHMNPGVPIMKSTNLVNWEIVNYVYPTLGTGDAENLNNGKNEYGRGSWASSLRYKNGIYYVSFMSYTLNNTFIFQTADIESGAWTRYALGAAYHDSSLLFDDDGRVYLVYGAGDIKVIELTSDARAIKAGGLNKILITNAGSIAGSGGLAAEGAHIHKINGKYYIFLISWPSGGSRTELVYRADSIDGAYQGRVLLTNGVAQGGVVDTPDGKWYAMLFQDTGSVGRIPFLVPVTWNDNWPVLGSTSDTGIPVTVGSKFAACDGFDGGISPGLMWQWNHNPDNSYWSYNAARPGYFRIVNGSVRTTIHSAKNTLTQRTFGGESSAIVAMETGGMKDGDYAGLSAFQYYYGFVGVKMSGTSKSIVMVRGSTNDVNQTSSPVEIASVPVNQNRVYLKVYTDFRNRTDKAYFYYSLDGIAWTAIGSTLQMAYTLPHFMGYRFGLFTYATKSTGGYADFDYFTLEPPPAGGCNINSTVTPTNTPTPAVKSTWRVMAGSSSAYTDSQGTVWAADMNYSGGTAFSTTNTVSNALPAAPDQALYQSERYGSPFTYVFNVPAGSYQVTLKFAETYWAAAGARLFNVSVNGAQVLSDFDLYSAAGGANKALDRVFNNITPVNGAVTIQFGPASVDNAKVDSIQIITQPVIPTNTPTSTPCAPTAITPYIQVDGGAWQQASGVTVSLPATVNLGPQPTTGGSWSWTGPAGFTSTLREIDAIPLSVGTNVYTATYTNVCGAKSTQAFTITVLGTSTPTNTPITPSATPTPPVPTDTPITPTATPTTPVPTDTPITPSATPTTPVPTNTPITPTATPTTPVPTDTPITPTATPTTPVPTDTPITPTATPTTPVPSATATVSPQYTFTYTETRTNTPIIPTSTSSVVPTSTPTTPITSGITLQLKSGDTNESTSSPHPQIRVMNTGTAAINLDSVEARYWLNCDCTSGQSVQAWVDWAGKLPAGSSITGNVQISVVTAALGTQTHYVRIKFTGGIVLQPGEYAEIQARFNKSDWSAMLQSNDWSYAAYTAFTTWNRITGYVNGTRVWGQEPTAVVQNIDAQVASVLSYPNPATSVTGTTLSYVIEGSGLTTLDMNYSIPDPAAKVDLCIYTMTGRLIWKRGLSGVSNVSTGNHIVSWDGKTAGGQELAAGTYILKVSVLSNGNTSSKSFVIIMLK